MKIGLVGYGKMGKGIFNLLSSLDHEIVVWTRKSENARESKDQMERKLKRALRNEIINQDQFQEKLSGLIFTDRLEALRECGLVIESIAEDFHEKVSMLKRLESILSPAALLLTNTSSLSINQLARELDHGERFCGFHFFYPIPLVNLVEIIKWDEVSGETVNFLTAFAHELGRKPIIINDAPASGINDILGYFFFEGYYMLEQGLAAPSLIDRAALSFCRVGPCESTDIIGSRLVIDTAERTVKVRKEGMPIPDLLYKLILQERLGRDCGRGLFIYHGEKMEDDSREFYLNLYQNHSFQASGQDTSGSMITDRLLYALFNGFLHSVSRAVSSEEELNIGMKEVLGMREGPADMIRAIGRDAVMEKFDVLANQVGRRFRQ